MRQADLAAGWGVCSGVREDPLFSVMQGHKLYCTLLSAWYPPTDTISLGKRTFPL